MQGVYFADMMSKSANYCYASLSQGTGLLLLAEVAVAPFNDLTQANYNADAECKEKNKLYVTPSPSLTPPHLLFLFFHLNCMNGAVAPIVAHLP